MRESLMGNLEFPRQRFFWWRAISGEEDELSEVPDLGPAVFTRIAREECKELHGWGSEQNFS
jgi:hypothetical protein